MTETAGVHLTIIPGLALKWKLFCQPTFIIIEK